MKAEIKKFFYLTMATHYLNRAMRLMNKRIETEKKMFKYAEKAGWKNGKFEG